MDRSMDRSFGYDQAAFPPYDAAPRPPAVQGEVGRPDAADLPAVPGKQLLLGLQRHTHTHTHPVVKVDRRIRRHYTTTILRLHELSKL